MPSISTSSDHTVGNVTNDEKSRNKPRCRKTRKRGLQDRGRPTSPNVLRSCIGNQIRQIGASTIEHIGIVDGVRSPLGREPNRLRLTDGHYSNLISSFLKTIDAVVKLRAEQVTVPFSLYIKNLSSSGKLLYPAQYNSLSQT